MQEATSAIDTAFISHMHEHAAKLDELRDYITRMRNVAYDVEMAEDLATTRAAAEQISAQCQGCHAAAGVNVPE